MTSVLHYHLGIAGLTLQAECYDHASPAADAVATVTLDLAEDTNRIGYYTASTTHTGLFWVRILTSGQPLEEGYAKFVGGNSYLSDLPSLLDWQDAISRTVQVPAVDPPTGDELELIVGNDYLEADGRELPFSVTGLSRDWPDTSVISLLLKVNGLSVTVVGTIVTFTGSTRSVKFSLTAASYASLGVGDGTYSILIQTPASHNWTVVHAGPLTVCPS